MLLHNRFTIGIVLLAAFFSSGHEAQAQVPKVILHTPYADLAFKKAADGKFPLLVKLRGASKFLALPVAASADDFHTVADQISAGNPFASMKVRAVISGAEEGSVAVWMRPLRAGNATCALVEEEFGYEHIKRNHTLICINDGKQSLVWSKEGGDFPYGPTLTAVDIKSDGQFIYYEGTLKPDGPETFEVSAFKVAKGKIEPLVRPVQTITAAVFSSADEARKTRDASQSKACRFFWVIQNGDGQYSLAAKTIDENVESLRWWKDWRECYPNLRVSTSQ